jgi:hypothetical protein
LEALDIISLRMIAPSPMALRVRVVSYALGAYKVFVERFVIKT